MNEKKITFRMAKEKDAGLVMSFIRQLSVYEEMEDSVQATEELLRENLFRKRVQKFYLLLWIKKKWGWRCIQRALPDIWGNRTYFLIHCMWRKSIEERALDRRFLRSWLKLPKSAAMEGSNGSASKKISPA